MDELRELLLSGNVSDYVNALIDLYMNIKIKWTMKAIKIFGTLCAVFALLCLTGYDCPECDFAAQTIALCVSATIALACGMIVAKNEWGKPF